MIVGLVWMVTGAPALAQSGSTGAVTGTVRDQTGAVVPQAEATIRNTATNAQAMERLESLAEAERDAVVTQLARLTGLPAHQIDRKTLQIPVDQVSRTLLAAEHLMVGRYDSRLVGPPDPAPQYDPTTDPSLRDVVDTVSVVRYLRDEIGFRSDIFYQGPFGGGYPPPATFRGDWMSTRWNRGASPTGPEGGSSSTRACYGMDARGRAARARTRDRLDAASDSAI